MAFTGADIHPGDHVVWGPGQPPRQPYGDGTGPLLAMCIVLRACRPDEVTSMGLDGSEDWFWAASCAGLSPPEVMAASMAYTVSTPSAVDSQGLLEYFGQ